MKIGDWFEALLTMPYEISGTQSNIPFGGSSLEGLARFGFFSRLGVSSGIGSISSAQLL
jgi:hypothetical protein